MSAASSLLSTSPHREYLRQFLSEWQMLADLSFSDFLMWMPTAENWFCVAQVRATTAPCAVPEDYIGRAANLAMQQALQMQEVFAPGQYMHLTDVIAVNYEGKLLALVTQHSDSQGRPVRGRLESTYLQVSQRLFAMVRAGQFPQAEDFSRESRVVPRVGDGVMLLSAAGVVDYASPNAISASRRLGLGEDIQGLPLRAQIHAVEVREEDNSSGSTTKFGPDPRQPWLTEIAAAHGTVVFRGVPLFSGADLVGTLVLLRDVSELRRRERQLLTKDATIREVHHRVKNNLQTLAAILRLQGRRARSGEARTVLADAGRRVDTIASVHEAMSGGLVDGVSFDDIAVRTVEACVDMARIPGREILTSVTGRFGRLHSDDATALAMVLSELLGNAIEHGLAGRDGRIAVQAQRHEYLVMTVRDDGAGISADWEGSPGLGTQIMRALVQDRGGSISWEALPTGGTAVCVKIPASVPA